MLCTNEASDVFDLGNPALLEQFGGQFAVMCGKLLLGVCPSLDEALQTVTEAFSDGLVEEGVPISIREIGASPGVSVVAQPARALR